MKREHVILGIIVQEDLKWQSQCEEMVKRATSTTWALRRMRALGVPQATLVEYWKAEGRVRLEYGCPVWHSSLTIAQSHSLDRAQRAAMAAITVMTVTSGRGCLTVMALTAMAGEMTAPARPSRCPAYCPSSSLV